MTSTNSTENCTIDQEICGIHTLDDILKFFQDSEVSNFVESAVFDVKSQMLISHFTQLLKKEVKIESKEHDDDSRDSVNAKIIRLSDYYKNKYIHLLNSFKQWKMSREKLIKILTNSAIILKRKSTFVSTFKVLTSVADICGTFLQGSGKSHNSWFAFVMEHASLVGLTTNVIEINYFKKLYNDVRKVIEDEQEMFEKIKADWWKHTRELEDSIESFFPHGIDDDIAMKIHSFSSTFDDGSKLFISIVLSNMVKDVSLVKNTEFLVKADCVASSEVGLQYFNRAISEHTPFYSHYLNSKLCDKLLQNLTVSLTEEFFVDLCKNLSSTAGFKVTLNMLSIISSTSDILFRTNAEVCDQFQELAKKSKEELQEIEESVDLLKPSNLEFD